MLKNILSDIKNNILAHMNHDPGSNGGKDDTDDIHTNQYGYQRKQQIHIFIGNRIIQRLLINHRCKQGCNAAQCTQHKCQCHLAKILFNVYRSPKQMMEVKGSFQDFVFFIGISSCHCLFLPSCLQLYQTVIVTLLRNQFLMGSTLGNSSVLNYQYLISKFCG